MEHIKRPWFEGDWANDLVGRYGNPAESAGNEVRTVFPVW